MPDSGFCYHCGKPWVEIDKINRDHAIARWIQGFHAALYREFPWSVIGAIHEPFPSGNTPGADTNLQVSHAVFVRDIQANRAAGRLGSIIANDGKCRYECTWSHLDYGRPMCFLALDVSAWHGLGDTNNHPARSCVGWCQGLNGIPGQAARATTLEVAFPNAEPLKATEVEINESTKASLPPRHPPRSRRSHLRRFSDHPGQRPGHISNLRASSCRAKREPVLDRNARGPERGPVRRRLNAQVPAGDHHDPTPPRRPSWLRTRPTRRTRCGAVTAGV